MGGYKRIPKEIKEEVLGRIKQGVKISQLSGEYGINARTMYAWLEKGVSKQISPLEFARLKRERDDLLRLVGNLTLEVEKRKKKRGH